MARPEVVYARAVYEFSGGGEVAKSAAAGMKDFWEQCVGSPALLAAATRPGIAVESRAGLVLDVAAKLGLGGLPQRILLVLARASRLSLVPAVVAELEVMVDRASNLRSGSLVSAVELSAEDVSGLSAAISKRVGSRVRFSQSVDPELLGGFLATVDGKTYDATLRGQLERFKKELI